jgi:YVTN family beta-propeller protein
LWFSAEGSKAVGSYDPSSNIMDWSMGTGQDRTHMIYVTTNAKKIYTTNVSSGTVSIIYDTVIMPGNTPSPPPNARPRDEWRQIIIPVARGSEGFDVTPDSAELWTASAEDGKIYIIDLETKKLSGTINANVTGANRLKFTTDGKLAFITSLRTGNLTIYDTKTRKLFRQMDIGHGAAGILMQPDGARAYVACTPDNYVVVIDLKTFEIVNKIDVGGGPDGLAWVVQK